MPSQSKFTLNETNAPIVGVCEQVPFHSQMGGLVSGPQIAVEASCPAMPVAGEGTSPQLPAKLLVEV